MNDRQPTTFRETGGYRVETPEQIELEYDIAGLGSRAIAAIIDNAILTAVYLLVLCVGFFGVAALAGSIGDAAGAGDSGFWIVIALVILLSFGIVWGYFTLFETLWHGQTPGKRSIGLRVIREGGYPIGFSQAAIRNLVRIVDSLPSSYALGAVVMLVDKRSRRLGDMAAGTVVVREQKAVSLDSLSMPVTSSLPAALIPTAGNNPPLPNLHRLTSDDQSVLRDYFNRRATLDPQAASKLSLTLAQRFASKIEYQPSGDMPDQFLARILIQLQQPSQPPLPPVF